MLALVFSKDRPLQLDACLRSLRRHAVGDLHVTVLWAASGDDYAREYAAMADAYEDVYFHKQGNFEEDVRWWLVRNATYRLLCVDDTLFVRPWNVATCELTLLDPRVVGYSLRLGKNTTHCYPTGQPQAVPGMLGDVELQYAWPGCEGDFGYPLEVSSSVYRTEDLRRWLKDAHFGNPNELELALQARRDECAVMYPMLALRTEPCAFAAAVNRVQNQFANRFGGRQDQSPGALLDVWRSGRRINIAHFDGYESRSCHAETEFPYEPRPMLASAYEEQRAAALRVADLSRAVANLSINPALYDAMHKGALEEMGYGGAAGLTGESGERAVLERLRGIEDPVVFDVGAHHGEYMRLVREVLPTARVVCFEPSPTAYATLAAWNEAGDAELKAYGLSNREAWAPLYSDVAGSGMDSVYKRRAWQLGRAFTAEQQVQLRELDNVARELGVGRIDLLKIDVEGSELAVLQGAQGLLATGAIKRIQWEMGGTNIDSRTYYRDFWELLSQRYRIMRLTPGGLVEVPAYEERLEVFVCSNHYAELRDGEG